MSVKLADLLDLEEGDMVEVTTTAATPEIPVVKAETTRPLRQGRTPAEQVPLRASAEQRPLFTAADHASFAMPRSKGSPTHAGPSMRPAVAPSTPEWLRAPPLRPPPGWSFTGAERQGAEDLGSFLASGSGRPGHVSSPPRRETGGAAPFDGFGFKTQQEPERVLVDLFSGRVNQEPLVHDEKKPPDAPQYHRLSERAMTARGGFEGQKPKATEGAAPHGTQDFFVAVARIRLRSRAAAREDRTKANCARRQHRRKPQA